MQKLRIDQEILNKQIAAREAEAARAKQMAFLETRVMAREQQRYASWARATPRAVTPVAQLRGAGGEAAGGAALGDGVPPQDRAVVRGRRAAGGGGVAAACMEPERRRYT